MIAPRRMLVSVAEPVMERADPVMASFLAFLAGDIAKAPETIKPISRDLARRIDRVVDGVAVAHDESLERKACSDGGQWLDTIFPYFHPLFQQQLEKLTAQVEALQAKDPAGYKERPAIKLLATINRYIREIIPRDPNAAEFRQGQYTRRG